MGELEEEFRQHTGRLVTKWRHYFEVYERHFAPYRGRPIQIVEFGVWQGGSLQLWRRYFGPQARIVGVDVKPECAAFAEEGTDIVIGDQADPALHRELRARYGAFDIVIDDGGHTMEQQATTFRELYPAVRAGGVYLVEDTHSSYHAHWGGGLRRPGTFIEQAKLLIDQLHAWYGPVPGLEIDEITRTAFALHFYDSMVVIEKRQVEKPVSLYRGEATLPLNVAEMQFLAHMDVQEGRRDQAIARYKRALEVLPDDPTLRGLLRQVESGTP